MLFKLKPLAVAILMFGFSQPLWADGNPAGQTLETINVNTQKREQKLGEERQKRKALDEKMVQDEYDLVRYDTGVSVVEGGRSGSNGFAIRGVDKDRVAINVDGLAQAESRSSEAFQELFGAYGNFNANRNTSEIENFSEVVVSKGADSLKSGGGALGGAVNYKTKSPSDYLKNGKPYHIGVKGGFVGRNSQKFSSITLAGALGGFEALLVYTHRRGQETKNKAGNTPQVLIKDDGSTGVYNHVSGNNGHYGGIGVARNRPDPQSWTGKSTLMKGGYRFSANHYLGTAFEDSRLDRRTEELSNMWTGNWKGEPLGDVRHRQDMSYRRRVGFEYRNQLDGGPWDRLTLRWDKQRIDMNTWTWDLPTDIYRSGINASVYHMFRTIRQNTVQAAAEADKEITTDKFNWLTQYGLGWGKGDNSNGDHSYFVKLYDSGILTSNQQKLTYLVESESKNRYAYWNNIFRFGDGNRFKLNAGLRYDQSSSRAKDNPAYSRNVRAQIPGLGESRKYGGLSYGLGVDWAFHNNLSLLAKAGSGFRAPTSDETWLLFPHPDFYLKANPKLKGETAHNIELGLAGSGHFGQFRASGFYTKYKNFIELAYLGGSKGQGSGDLEAPLANGEYLIGAPVWQNQNRSSAAVSGIELGGRWRLDSIGLPKGMYTGLNATYIRGKAKQADGKRYPINALSPWSAVWNFGYDAPASKWGAALHLTHTAAKKPSDTIHSNDDLANPWPFARHSKAYTLLDVSAYTQVGKHFTVRAAVNNLTDKKYYSWDALRGIREFGTVNRVDRNTHAGIERFTSPGRSFNLTLEAKF